MKRCADLKELVHSLTRSRVFAEQLGYDELANQITQILPQLRKDIEYEQSLKPAVGSTGTSPVPRATKPKRVGTTKQTPPASNDGSGD